MVIVSATRGRICPLVFFKAISPCALQMAALWNTLRQATSQVLRQATTTTTSTPGACSLWASRVTPLMPSSVQLLQARLDSSYNAYPKFDETPEPFAKRQLIRYGLKYRFFKGGMSAFELLKLIIRWFWVSAIYILDDYVRLVIIIYFNLVYR